MLHDAAIVGGGPAGLSAAIWLARYLHDVVLVDSGDPRNWETRGVNGYLGHPHIRPADLRRLGREECRRYGGKLVDGCVDRAVRRSDDCFELGLENGDRYRARRLLLAFGIRDAWPSIPGLGRVYGETAHVCPDCDGYESRGSTVVVVGSGRRAAGTALSLTTWTRRIALCTHGEAPQLEPDLLAKLEALDIPVLTAPIARVHERDGKLTQLELAGGEQIACDRLFFSIAQYPSDDLGVQLGCDRDDDGQIIIDAHGHTSVHHVFAAGDVVPGPQLAITAAAGGAVAAMAIHKSLVPEGRKP
ncbi:MAG TPA: NAD(P)/FAD-dependent oxidoreductase [Gemmatimonadaceae bacterium]|nr:NAD(P)/FAD-dependent oxidoreductase [Gemmatimonadaceae bacterium]